MLTRRRFISLASATLAAASVPAVASAITRTGRIWQVGRDAPVLSRAKVEAELRQMMRERLAARCALLQGARDALARAVAERELLGMLKDGGDVGHPVVTGPLFVSLHTSPPVDAGAPIGHWEYACSPPAMSIKGDVLAKLRRHEADGFVKLGER